jgi:hypothetical protein
MSKKLKRGVMSMSAFMVADTTINRVVTWLSREMDHMYFISRKLHELGIDTSRAGWEEKLGQAMFQLNIDGVNARYGDGEAKDFRNLNYTYQSTYFLTTIQVYKSLECWLYQCCEGNVPETPLYKLFDQDIKAYIAQKIIYSLPAFDQAEWG